MRLRRAAVFAALFICCTLRFAVAQDVTLTSQDGDIVLSGNLLGFDGEFYRVDTIYGELTIDSAGVTCTGNACPDLQAYVADISISGSALMGSVMMPALVEAYARQSTLDATREILDASHYTYTLSDPATGRPAGIFRFRVTTTDEGFADLLANEADIVMAQRGVRPDEVARALEAGMGDLTSAKQSKVLALDAVVPVVAPGNPVTALKPGELAQLFAGTITQWPAPGGSGRRVVLYAASPGSGAGQAMFDQIMDPEDLEMSNNISTFTNTSDLASAVTDDPESLGVTAFSGTGDTKLLHLAAGCIRPIQATRRGVKTGDYPYTAPMFLYQPARRLPKLARGFLSFVSDPAAQLVIRRSGFVDQTPEEISPDDQGSRFANAIASAGERVTLADLQRMTQVLAPMNRLTTTFRTEPGTSDLTAQSRGAVVHLVGALESGRFDGRELLFAGFSDASGAAPAGQSVSLRAAERLREMVLEQLPATVRALFTARVDAFGEAMPIGCDGSPAAREASQRVEVWIR
ncbi:substrate-binding domain-containing protein [Roseobacter ponti]|uniref:Cell envelope biogenesis protein OmpA n=1 Tax=Roseobacter ponti TaxID=1891787 RepID=A0A858SS83_9RHOB|nr:substrate-binding domain-containing protein [Roseobacter ponti]QJF49776.1 cell envelope biogenesis protein OmpA [Roseobacter ponti]